MGGALRGIDLDAEKLQALVDGTGEQPDRKGLNVIPLSRTDECGKNVGYVANVGEEFRDRQQAVRRFTFALEGGGNVFEELFDVAEKQVLFVAIVGVESGAAHAGAVEKILNRDFIESFFLHECEESIAERVARAHNAGISF